MGKISPSLLLTLLVICFALVTFVGGYNHNQDEGPQQPGGGGGGGEEMVKGNRRFLLQESLDVVRTVAGEMRILRTGGFHPFRRSPIHVGLIAMEPNSLFIPQYLDSSLILFIRRGEARVGHIHNDDLTERNLTTGDVYRIGSGSAFYLVNTAEGQKLHIICSIDTSDNYGLQLNEQGFQSFFVAGGTNPTSILSGFDPFTMSTALNVSLNQLGEIMSSQKSGPIVFLPDSGAPSVWSKFLDQNQHQRLAHLKRIMHLEEQEEEEQPTWSFRKLLISIFGQGNNGGDEKGGKGQEPYNLYDRKPDFENDYGWSKALDERDYPPLRHSDVSVYLVNLTAGSMMAPHVNPRATEYGIVLSGVGNIQIVFPNGTMGMNAQVKEGDAFWVPRYFPFCQIASRSGAFEFVGFTTSSQYNKPQFLVGANSVMQNMAGPEVAAAFGVREETLREIVDAQSESTILPSPSVAPPGLKTESAIPEVIRNFGTEMLVDFD